MFGLSDVLARYVRHELREIKTYVELYLDCLTFNISLPHRFTKYHPRRRNKIPMCSQVEEKSYAEFSNHVQTTGAVFQFHEEDTVCVRCFEREDHLFSNMSIHLRREAQGLDVHQFIASAT